MKRIRMSSLELNCRCFSLGWCLLVIGVAATMANSVFAQAGKPNKQAIVKVLRQLEQRLNAKEYESALGLLEPPEGFKAEMLEELADQIISADGIEALEKRGQFGTVDDLFTDQQVKFILDRSPRTEMEGCYGLKYEMASLIAFWDGQQFSKIVWMEGIDRVKIPREDLAKRREKLVSLLKVTAYLLENEDYDRAARFFAQPPGFEPSMLASLVKNREVSLAGVRRLAKEADFGSAAEIFEPERAQIFVEKFGVEMEQCYGFNFKTPEAAGEVLAVWSGDSVKLIRLDDVGKLKPGSPLPSATFEGNPDKATLVKTLEIAFELIDNYALDEAEKLFVLGDADKEELLSLLRLQEISAAGIELMQQHARFGPAAEILGADRANILTRRVGIDPATCYAMVHQANGETGEVAASWDGSGFKIFRLNNVGKLVPDPRDVESSGKESPSSK